VKIHFIGIGGIGLSAIARYLKKLGHIISGSDMSETTLTKLLKKEGIKVNIPHTDTAISDQDMVVYSAVIKDDNPELKEARERGIKCLSRKEMLPFVLGDRKVYSVCGAHGKSTTTAILSSILDNSSALIGAELKSIKSNMKFTNSSDIMAFEADESDGSFLNSNPYCAIVTNCEPEHMEYYNYDEKRFYQAYEQFIRMAKVRVINAEDEFLSTLTDLEAIRLYPSRDIKNLEFILKDDHPYTRFELKDLGTFEVWGFGEHIAIDASLAILASLNEIGLEEISDKIKNFKGIKKRFDILKTNKESVLIDDYGHHPTEIEATMSSIKMYANLKSINNVVTVWQPHKYSRTIDNLSHFQTCFKGTDQLIILPVWSAGENIQNIDFENKFAEYNLTMADKIKPVGDHVYVYKNDEIIQILDKGLIIGFGAGDITYQLRGAS
jgi:UDP-N-acetylmuramate--alanine ligase